MILTNINTAGTEIANTWLKSHGYFKISTIHIENRDYIEADGKIRRILLILKVAEVPNKPEKLTSIEISAIKTQATKVEREPWSAEIQVDPHKQLVGEIIWYDLSKVH